MAQITEEQFSELRNYAEADGSCIDMGYRPSSALISRGLITEVVSGCWSISAAGTKYFDGVLSGMIRLKPNA